MSKAKQNALNKKKIAGKLIIDSLHDAQAHSSNGKWNYTAMGPRTKKEIRDIFKKTYK